MRTLQRAFIALVLITTASVAAFGVSGPTDLEKTPQARAYRAQIKAAAAGDYDAFKKLTTAEVVALMEKQMKEMGKAPKDGLQLLTILTPQDIHFTDLKVTGKKATLSMTGKSDGQPQKGTVEFAQEGGQWKVGRQEWGSAK